jgi:hypothetical protein
MLSVKVAQLDRNDSTASEDEPRQIAVEAIAICGISKWRFCFNTPNGVLVPTTL